MQEKALALITELQHLQAQLRDPAIYSDVTHATRVAQQLKALEPKAAIASSYLSLLQQRQDAEQLLSSEKDPEMLELAKAELEDAKTQLPTAEEALTQALIPVDPDDERDCIIEVRAGVGGDEACLFAEEAERMWLRFAEMQGFTTHLLSSTPNESGGIKESIIEVHGYGAYGKLKYESGVHRVQRVPRTESQGRLHTSAISAVVMPEVEQTTVEIHPNDLRIDVFRSSGNGGQSVNTTDSAVRVTHLPTGIIVTCQDDKSQHKNKAKAIKVLASRLHAIEEEARREALGEKRLSSIGSGDRSEKVRTYNFPQDRVTDHRIGQNFSNLPGVLDGNLLKIVEALAVEEQRLRLA
ncbi:peptide chain release factor 1 [Candidatus Peribacteria bacterium]|nr:peptide chain release factor 1 [Candidatus Peribacteria bacterium]